MIRATFFLIGAFLLMQSGILTLARQAEPRSAGRVIVTDYGAGRFLYREWRDERGRHRLTEALQPGPPAADMAAWSPDGRQIAFINTGLNIINMDTGHTNRLRTGSDMGPSWSPDGRSLAYLSFDGGPPDIYVIDLGDLDNPPEPQRISSEDSGGSLPEWSPDGEWIVFSAAQDGFSDIFRVRPDGSDLQNLTNSSELNEYAPLWSGDGDWIHYQLRHDVFRRMRVDGTRQESVDGGARVVIDQSQIPIISLNWRPVILWMIGLVMLIFARWIKS